MGSSFSELFAPLYSPIPDSGKYLERIGVDAVKTPDKENLDKLVVAHQRNVPFENLDVYDAETELSLYISDLYDKIVTRRRGGYCFELNSAFMELLKSVGYECYPTAARVIWHAACTMPLSHRVTIVTIGGVRYFCDVGFGGPSPQGAIMLDEPGPQQSGSNIFVFSRNDGSTVINRLVDGEHEPLLMFTEIPYDPVDFLALNEYQSRSKNSNFKKSRTLNLVTETGNITLGGNVLRVNSDSDPVEITLGTEDELRAAIKDYFGIAVDFPLKM